MDEHGMDAIGAAVTGTDAIGTTGMAIGIIIIILSSSLETSDFHGGGAGDGALAGAGATLTMGTTMVIRTVTDMDIPATVMAITGMETAMDMGTAAAANTALPLGRGLLNSSADSHAPVITTVQSTVSWGRKRGGQSGITSRTMVTQIQDHPILRTDSQRASF